MKQTLFILYILLLSFASCKNKNGKEMTVTGKWKPVEMNIREMNEAEIKDAIEYTIIEFSDDGKFTANSKENKQNGTYTYNKEDKTLIVIRETAEDHTQKFTIGWDEGDMLMTNEEGTVKLKRQ